MNQIIQPSIASCKGWPDNDPVYTYRQETTPPLAILHEKKRRVKVAFSSETPVWREASPPFYEVLSHTPEAVDCSRLNQSAPVLLNHQSGKACDQVGVVERAWLENQRGYAVVRFSQRASLDELWQDIQEGIVTQLSVGYRILEYEPYTPECATRALEDTAPYVLVTRWCPYEISVVTLAADPTVGIGRHHSFLTSPLTSSQEILTMNTTVPKTTQPEATSALAGASEVTQQDSLPTQPKDVDVNHFTSVASASQHTANEALRAIEREKLIFHTLEQEKVRRATVRHFFNTLPMSVTDEFQQQCLDNPVLTLDTVKARTVDQLAATSAATAVTPKVEMVSDEHDNFRLGAVRALSGRCGLDVAEKNNPFCGWSLTDFAKRSLRLSGESYQGLNRLDLVGRAFTHASSDFPLILSSLAEKSLLKGYTESPESFTQWTSESSVADFKIHTRVDTGPFPELFSVPEGGNYQSASFGERGETVQLATYGAMFSLTRQAIVNDDLHCLTQIPKKMGRAALRTLGNCVYGVLLNNPKQQDGFPLFSEEHNNVNQNKVPFGPENLTEAQRAMRTQRYDNTPLDIQPKFLLVPVSLKNQAQLLMSSDTDPTQLNARVPNLLQSEFTVISEPRLDLVNKHTWYLLADPHQYDGVEVIYLDGQTQPVLEQQRGWQVDGVEFKVRLDAGVKALDHRTVYRHQGSEFKTSSNKA